MSRQCLCTVRACTLCAALVRGLPPSAHPSELLPSCCWPGGANAKTPQGMPSGPDATSPAEAELVAVIERTRAVAERWKALHLREEGLCAEQRQLARQSARSVDSAREMRDKAVEVQKAAQLDTVAAKHEKARWRARADAQSNAKVFLEAERLRGALLARDQDVALLQQALGAARKELERPGAPSRTSAETALLAENVALRQTREAAEKRAGQLKAKVDELKEQMRQQLASFPPETFEAQKVSLRESETRAMRAEEACELLKRQVDTWKQRARDATASQRLGQMEAAAMAAGAAASPRTAFAP